MKTVKVYNAENAVFDERELTISELPPVSDYVKEILLEIGGTCNGYPNVRIVSGLDPDIVEFVGGRWWRTYCFREHIKHEYTILHKQDGTKKILSPKEAQVAAGMKKLDGILIPVVDRKIIEHGIPRYFVEYYKPAEYYGSEEAWNAIRYDKDDEGNTVDLMGDFPSEGRYETWFCVEEAVEDKDGNVVNTVFKPIDDIVIELIRHKVMEARSKTAAQQHIENRQTVDAEYNKHREELKEEVRDIIADNIDRIID